MFYFGIEHEVAFLNKEGKFADFSCTKFEDWDRIIEKLPVYPEDYSQLRIGDAGIKQKRWYIEGFERLSDSEKVIDCVPKGIEIRTTIQGSIEGAIAELSDSFSLLRQVATNYGFTPVLVSFNPYHPFYEPHPPLNDYERKRIEASPEKQTEHIPMVTYGPDLNISLGGLTAEQLIDIGRKLTFYSPYIVPLSFSSPFYQGSLWKGQSIRTYIRTGSRQAVRVFLEKQEDLIKSTPSLTKIARISAEVGRIEFKAFDSCDNFQSYGGLLALLKGIILDCSLLKRATIPDPALHQTAAVQGFNNPMIRETASQIIEAAEIALAGDSDINFLQELKPLLNPQENLASKLSQSFQKLGTIEAALQETYADKRLGI